MKTLLVLCLALAAPLAAHASSQGEAIISGMNVCMNHSSGAEALRCAKDGFAAADHHRDREEHQGGQVFGDGNRCVKPNRQKADRGTRHRQMRDPCRWRHNE